MHLRSEVGFLVVVVAATAGAARASAPADALAAAVRATFDAPAQAEAALEDLHARWPDDDDVAWWLAAARLDRGDGAGALALLDGRVGRGVPTYRFDWLRARAWSTTDPARARAALEAALPRADADPDRPAMLALAARLAAAAGDDTAAARWLRAGAADPDLRLWTWRVPPFPLTVVADGRAWDVGPIGLARPAHVANGDVHEVPGPDLAGPDGAPCLPRGVRADPAPGADGWIYAAIDAPEGAGLHTFATCGGAPRLLVSGSGLSSPADWSGALWWVADQHVRGPGAPWPDVTAVRISVTTRGLLVVAWDSGAPRLRIAPAPGAPLVPVFAEDPAITRASAPSSPGAGSPPAAPPPPPARPR